MTNKEYIESVLKTESQPSNELIDRVSQKSLIRLNHGADGLVTEAGEILDALKKHKYYGKTLDLVNLKEEIGDALWYIAILLDELNITFEEVMETNINKLKARYKDKFTEEAAINRNLDLERTVLEAKSA